MHNEPTILLVDDDTNDVLLFRIALGSSPLEADLRVAHSGLEALKYLSGYGVYENRVEFPMPGIVLLDLHMPGIDGLAVLRWIRRQRSLAGLPVIVFTGDERLRAEAMEYGADIYMCKGEDTGELLALLQHINLHWQRPALTAEAYQENGSFVSQCDQQPLPRLWVDGTDLLERRADPTPMLPNRQGNGHLHTEEQTRLWRDSHARGETAHST